MSIRNLQHALSTAASTVRDAHPTLTDQDVQLAYGTYQQHFDERRDDPPVSDRPELDELLLALWDVIVDRETEGADEADGELEDLYSAAFAALQLDGDTGSSGPVALTPPVEDEGTGPARMLPTEEEVTDFPHMVEEEDDVHAVIYRLKIALDDGNARPRIWRRVLVPADLPQTQLHHILQAAMGWRGSEDFQFYPPQQQELPSTGEPRLVDLLFSVEHDCGYEFDNWYHNLSLEEKTTAVPDHHYPECIAGQGACPPEDIGGMTEYKRMLSALEDPSSPDYAEMAGWITQDFNPDTFNIDQANARLGKYGGTEFRAVV